MEGGGRGVDGQRQRWPQNAHMQLTKKYRIWISVKAKPPTATFIMPDTRIPSTTPTNAPRGGMGPGNDSKSKNSKRGGGMKTEPVN